MAEYFSGTAREGDVSILLKACLISHKEVPFVGIGNVRHRCQVSSALSYSVVFLSGVWLVV